MATPKWRAYQEATANLFRKLGCEASVEYRAQGVRARHNVDVHVTFPLNGIKCTWIIECKLLRRRVTKEKVMALKSIIDDLGADRGIIFTEKGFQPGAEAAARSTNITLATSLMEFEKAALASPHTRVAPDEVATIFGEYSNDLDDALEEQLNAVATMETATKLQVIKSRRGQGEFRAGVLRVEPCCRLTGIANPRFLNVVHMKPWRACANADERLDWQNGLALAPHVADLFQRGLLGFKDNGDVMYSPFVTPTEIGQFGLDRNPHKVERPFLARQHRYLEYHRANVFRAG